MARKRRREEMEVDEPEPAKEEPTLLQQLRNLPEFAAFVQYLFLFGKAVKIADLEIEVCPTTLYAAVAATFVTQADANMSRRTLNKSASSPRILRKCHRWDWRC